MDKHWESCWARACSLLGATALGQNLRIWDVPMSRKDQSLAVSLRDRSKGRSRPLQNTFLNQYNQIKFNLLQRSSRRRKKVRGNVVTGLVSGCSRTATFLQGLELP